MLSYMSKTFKIRCHSDLNGLDPLRASMWHAMADPHVSFVNRWIPHEGRIHISALGAPYPVPSTSFYISIHAPIQCGCALVEPTPIPLSSSSYTSMVVISSVLEVAVAFHGELPEPFTSSTFLERKMDHGDIER